MANDGSFLLRGDDGQLYRVNQQQLAAFRLPAGDPLYKSEPTFAQATAKHGAGTSDEICFIGRFEK
jgi:hypothetical protein